MRAADRIFDEGGITDSARGREVLREEMAKYEAEGGKTTRTVEIPGTKRRKKRTPFLRQRGDEAHQTLDEALGIIAREASGSDGGAVSHRALAKRLSEEMGIDRAEATVILDGLERRGDIP